MADFTVKAGSVIVSKKPHPCGCREWHIMSVGADYKLKCAQCHHIIIVDYDALQKMIKSIINSSN